MEPSNIFTDHEGEPLRFFLPLTLVSRNSFKQKIEENGGVLVSSALMTNIIKIGDPAKHLSYDSSWHSFRFIDDALSQGSLPDSDFYVMSDAGHPPSQLVMDGNGYNHAPTQRQTPSSGGLKIGIGSRGTRQEFTPEEDDILRRIVHRPNVATSGNKIYQLIADKYGGHTFHSWRDRYIRHMRPIWGPPTDDVACVPDDTEQALLDRSLQRAPHTSQAVRHVSTRDMSVAEESVMDPEDLQSLAASPPPLPSVAQGNASKKQRAAFSTTDDEILLRALAEKGETASTYKMLGQRHPHHTWESWKNRVKALKKKNGGALPDFSQDMGVSNLHALKHDSIDLETPLPNHVQNIRHIDSLQQDSEQNSEHHHQNLVDPNIDPNLQLQQLGMIIDDPNQEAFEQQFANEYDPTQDLHMQEQLQQAGEGASTFDFPTTEEILRQNLQGHTAQDLDIQHLTGQGLPLDNEVNPSRGARRQIHIHNPHLDENAGPVSDIEDESQRSMAPQRNFPKRPVKKRKTNAAARAAAERAEALPKMSSTMPQTPSRQMQHPIKTLPKSAKLEHHQRAKTSLGPAAKPHASHDYMLHPTKQEVQDDQAYQQHMAELQDTDTRDIQGIQSQGAETLVRNIMHENDHQVHNEHQGHAAVSQSSGAQQSRSQQGKAARLRALQEVRATPNTSPVAQSTAQMRDLTDDAEFPNAFNVPSPTPNSPDRSISQSQYLQDSQAIRGGVDFDFHQFSLQAEDSLQEMMLPPHMEKKHNWIERVVAEHNLPRTFCEHAWYITTGEESLADQVIEAYAKGLEAPRIPGVWTEQDDEIIQSTDAQAMEELQQFHNGSVESRLLFLNQRS